MATEDTTAFLGKLSKAYNQAFIVMGVEIGHRLGIFDHMIKSNKPQTEEDIANALGLKQRYVKEWLGLVVCGGVVELSEGRYSIPEHRVPVLSSTSNSNGTLLSLLVGMCSRVSDDVTECFKLDGPKGVPYSKYPLLHPWRESIMNITFGTEDALMSTVNRIPGLLAKLEEGIEMCDLGCSTGVALRHFAEKFPKTQVYGYDISEDAIKFAQQKAMSMGLTNAHFAVQDCCEMPTEWTNRFDYVFVYDVVHDLPKPDRFLSEIHRILKPGCAAYIVDINMHTDLADNISEEFSPLGYGPSLFHCMVVSLNEDGMGLGTAWGIEKGEEMMKAAGFSKVEVIPEGQAYYICHK